MVLKDMVSIIHLVCGVNAAYVCLFACVFMYLHMEVMLSDPILISGQDKQTFDTQCTPDLLFF